jgi:hypothetical protein
VVIFLPQGAADLSLSLPVAARTLAAAADSTGAWAEAPADPNSTIAREMVTMPLAGTHTGQGGAGDLLNVDILALAPWISLMTE